MHNDEFILGLPWRCYTPIDAKDDWLIFEIVLIILNIITSSVAAFLICHLWFLICIHHGLPMDVDCSLIRIFTISVIFNFCGTLNIHGLRLGIPFVGISRSCSLLMGLIASTAMLDIMADARKIVRNVQGHSHLKSTERIFYTTCHLFIIMLGISSFFIYMISDNNIISPVWTDNIYFVITCFGCIISVWFTTSAVILYTWLLYNDPVAAKLILRYRNIWCVTFIVLCAFCFLTITWKFLDDTSTLQCGKDFITAVNAIPGTPQYPQQFGLVCYNHFCLWLVAVLCRNFLLRNLREKGLLHPRSNLVFVKTWCGVMCFLISWFALPYMVPFHLLVPILQSMLVIVLGCGMIWYWRHQIIQDDLLLSFSVAGRLCHREKNRFRGKRMANIRFFGPWVLRVTLQASLLIGVVTSRIIPWVPASKLSLFDIYQYISAKQVTNLFQFLLGCMVALYLCENILCIFTRTVSVNFLNNHDSIRRYCAKMWLAIEFLIYFCGALPAIRFLLGSTYCTEIGYLNINQEIPCNGVGWHLLLVLLNYNISAWFVGLRSLSFAANNLLSTVPTICSKPRYDIINTFLQCSIVIIMDLIDGRLMIIITFFIVFLFWIIDLRYPCIIGYPQLNWYQCSISSCVLHVYIIALTHFDYPYHFGLFIGLVVPLPFIMYSSYRFGQWYIGYSNMDIKVEEWFHTLNIIIETDISDKIINISSKDLGILLHTLTFRKYLYTHLDTHHHSKRRSTQLSSMTLSEKIIDESQTIKIQSYDALSLFERSLSTKCGLLAILQERELIRCIVPFLKKNIPIEQQKIALDICNNLLELLIEDIQCHCGNSIIYLWASTKDKMIHTLCNNLIQKIIGNDRIILYPGGNNSGPTPLHRELYETDINGIVKLQIVGRCIWMIPIINSSSDNSVHVTPNNDENTNKSMNKTDNDNNENIQNNIQKFQTSSDTIGSSIFSIDDKVDAILSCPPTNPLSSSMYQYYPHCPRLYVLTDESFTTFEQYEPDVQKEQNTKNYDSMNMHYSRFVLYTFDIPQIGQNTILRTFRNALSQYFRGMIKKIT